MERRLLTFIVASTAFFLFYATLRSLLVPPNPNPVVDQANAAADALVDPLVDPALKAGGEAADIDKAAPDKAAPDKHAHPINPHPSGQLAPNGRPSDR